MPPLTAVKDEPSMEEILASIRRIISEQEENAQTTGKKEKANGSGAAYALAVETSDDAEILNLTTVVNDDGTLTELPAADFLSKGEPPTTFEQALVEAEEEQPLSLEIADKESEEPPAPVLEIAEPALELPEPELEPEPEPALEVTPELEPLLELAPEEEPEESFAEQPDDEGIVSADTIAASVQSLATLHAAQEQQRLKIAQDARLATLGAPTLEDITKTLLKPLLKEWLDANLPAVVETIVREEVKRITGQVEG
jgi:cell pole-organizing protein PopZ